MDALPAFLLPQTSPDTIAPLTPAQRAELAATRRHNELVIFESCFERMMETIESGQPLTSAIEDYPLEVNYTRFLAWVNKDENRRQRYYEAQTTAAEVVAQQMLDIADASDTIEDVQRSTLRINTRKWLLGVWNRKRFGETRQIEQTVTIDLGEAMAAAQRRVLENRGDVIDVQGRIA
jgi:hypothetical protein